MGTPHLHVVRNLFSVREDLRQVLGAQCVPEGSLCQKSGCRICIGDIRHSQGCVLNTVIDHTIHADGHRVLSEDLQEEEGNLTPAGASSALKQQLIVLSKAPGGYLSPFRDLIRLYLSKPTDSFSLATKSEMPLKKLALSWLISAHHSHVLSMDFLTLALRKAARAHPLCLCAAIH